MTKVVIQVKVIPNSSKCCCEGWKEGVLRVRVPASPEKGKANAQLIEVLAEFFDTAKSNISILSGHSSRNKRVQINRCQ